MVVDEGPEVGHAWGLVGGLGGHDAVGRGWVDAGKPGEAREEREGRRVVAQKLHRAALLLFSPVLLFHREETLDCLNCPSPGLLVPSLRLLLFSLAESV